MNYIVTHPGSAHKDDFLACAVLAAEFSLPIYRRDPTESELQDPAVFVVDVGGRHDPGLMNFDHHQFPRDHPPSCSLSLVFQSLGVYEDAVRFCPWMKTAEWLDARGARQTAKWLEVDPLVVAQLSSPIDFSLLRYFAEEQELPVDHPIAVLMARIGADLLDYLRSLRQNLNALRDCVEFWKIGDLEICYLPKMDGMSLDLASALNMFVREQDRDIAGTISPDKRGSGFGLTRFDDDLRLNFTRIENEADVHFAHKQGFIAKTSATDPERLKQLLAQSCV
ncbi:MYG1 family protein [Kiritimatiellaeota bacterium B1221]|nr:MYG1 family protein [Kiritimatiellaeota bacterium B1221]